MGLSLIPSVLSLAGLPWGSVLTGGRPEVDAPLRLALFSILAVVVVVGGALVELLLPEDNARLLRLVSGPLAPRAPRPFPRIAMPFPSRSVTPWSPESPAPVLWPMTPARGTPTVEPPPAAAPPAPPAPAPAAAAEEEQFLSDLLDFFERTLPSPGPPPTAPGEQADRTIRELERFSWEMAPGQLREGLTEGNAPVVCPVCNTVNPPYRETCALCEQPLHLQGEAYMNCPECGVATPRRANRCFACGQVFIPRRVEDPLDITLHFVSLESLAESGNIHFMHFDPEAESVTYLLRTVEGYEIVTLVLRPAANPVPMDDDAEDPEEWEL